eukprot:1142877-Pelagomonas_calceolata.AAC.9
MSDKAHCGMDTRCIRWKTQQLLTLKMLAAEPLHSPFVHLGVRQVVHHPARRAHDDMRPLGKRDGLGHHVDAAHQHGAADSDHGAQRLHLLRNLDGQLTGGGEHQGIQLLRLVQKAL